MAEKRFPKKGDERRFVPTRPGRIDCRELDTKLTGPNEDAGAIQGVS
jgi:hypothetical protein